MRELKKHNCRSNAKEDAIQYIFEHNDKTIIISCEPRIDFVVWGIEIFNDEGSIMGYLFRADRHFPLDFNNKLLSVFELLVKHELIGCLT